MGAKEDAIEQQRQIDENNAKGLPAYRKTTPAEDKASFEDFKRMAQKHDSAYDRIQSQKKGHL